MDNFQRLPFDLLFEILNKLTLSDINKIISTDKYFNTLLNQNNEYWKRRYQKYYSYNIINILKKRKNYNDINWKEEHEKITRRILLFGWKEYKHITFKNKPIVIQGIKSKYISAMGIYVLILDLDSNVWLWEYYKFKKINEDNIEDKNINNNVIIFPINRSKHFISNITKIQGIKGKYISTGGNHGLIIDLDNNVWSCGNNKYGQLGLGDNIDRDIFTQIPNIKAKAISSGERCSLIIDLDNNVWLCGDFVHGYILALRNNKDEKNKATRYGMNTLIQIPDIRCKYIAVRNECCFLTDMNDNVLVFGDNTYDQLSAGGNRHIIIPISIVRNIPGLSPFKGFKGKCVSVGGGISGYHCLIIDLDNNIWSMGYNNHGELGLGDNNDRNIPTLIPGIKGKYVSAGNSHSLIIDLDDNVWACGTNGIGQLGLGDNINRNIFTKIPNIKGKHISAGEYYSLIIEY